MSGRRSARIACCHGTSADNHVDFCLSSGLRPSRKVGSVNASVHRRYPNRAWPRLHRCFPTAGVRCRNPARGRMFPCPFGHSSRAAWGALKILPRSGCCTARAHRARATATKAASAFSSMRPRFSYAASRRRATCSIRRRSYWPELTNWPSGTHKGTKQERLEQAGIESAWLLALSGTGGCGGR